MSTLQIKNPYSDAVLSEMPYATEEVTHEVLQNARNAFQRWRFSSSGERAQLLFQVANQLESEKEGFAQLISAEAGKPIRASRLEVDRAVGVLRWASAEAQRFAGELLRLDTSFPTASSGSQLSRKRGFGIHTRFPRGVILGITPFNFPLNLVIHKVAPAVACGCSIVIKPSPSTPLTALRLAQLFEVWVPGLVQVLMPEDSAMEKLTRASEIAMISFTGSSEVGKKIRHQAPEKIMTLELGGNAWVMVMPDVPVTEYADIARKVAHAAYGYAGQSCISVQNVAVAASIWEEFHPYLKAATETTPYGDPTLDSVISGPLINSRAHERVSTRVQNVHRVDGVEVMMSEHLEGTLTPTSLVAPTLVLFHSGKLTSSSEIYATPSIQTLVGEEIFGPVMTAGTFDHLDEVIQRVNSSRYGLQAGVYTENWTSIETLYQELEVGGLVVNDVPTTRYDHQPYGGVKASGLGREGLKYAMEEMTESKFLALSGRPESI